jgi:hypothetical protein
VDAGLTISQTPLAACSCCRRASAAAVPISVAAAESMVWRWAKGLPDYVQVAPSAMSVHLGFWISITGLELGMTFVGTWVRL